MLSCIVSYVVCVLCGCGWVSRRLVVALEYSTSKSLGLHRILSILAGCVSVLRARTTYISDIDYQKPFSLVALAELLGRLHGKVHRSVLI
jgi:hypothetical protein